MRAARKMPATVETVDALGSAMSEIMCTPCPHDAPLAVVLASAHGIGDINPIDNLLADIQHLAGSLVWLLGIAAEEVDAGGYASKVINNAWRSTAMIERRAQAAEILLSRQRQEGRAAPTTVAPPASEVRPKREPTDAQRAQAILDGFGYSRHAPRTVAPDASDDSKAASCERALRRNLDEGSRNAIELYQQIGSCSAHHAGIGRLLSLVGRVLDEAGDAELGGPETCTTKAVHEAGTALEFLLADWEVERANARDASARAAAPEESARAAPNEVP